MHRYSVEPTSYYRSRHHAFNMLRLNLAYTCFLLLLCAMLGRHTVEALSSSELSQFTTRSHSESNTGKQGSVSKDSSKSGYYVITSNGIPDHSTGTFPGTGNPNRIQSQSFTFKIPKSPSKAQKTSCLTMGPIAVSKNGIPLFNPNNHLGQNAVEGDNAEVFDSCDGHPDQKGVYHYHQTPDCLYTGANDEFIGVALDGFPIYGIKDSSGQELTSADLDSCHGHDYNGGYRYRLTRDYPYIMGCFKGTRMDQGGHTPPENCLNEGESKGSQSTHHLLVIISSVLLAAVTTL